MFCCGLHQACYSCLGCAVSLEHSHTVSACNRGYKDHVSALICFQMCQTMFDHMYGSHYIDIKQSLNLFCSCMHHILKGNYTCCIYDHINLSAAKCCCVSDQLLNVFFHSYITFCKAALYAKCLDLFYSSKALIFFTVCNIYVCATSCKLKCHLFTQSTSTTCNKDCLSSKINIHCHNQNPLSRYMFCLTLLIFYHSVWKCQCL